MRQNRVHKIHYIYYGAIEMIVDDSPLFVHAKIPAYLRYEMVLGSASFYSHTRYPFGRLKKALKQGVSSVGKVTQDNYQARKN